MGFAMIWVVSYHYQFEGLLAYPLGNGFTGVDLFMFVSGFGLFYSMSRDNDVLHFYKKRLLRIIPLYYLIGLIYELISGEFNFWQYLWKYSTLGFWTDSTYGFGWFIPSIFAIYAFYPFLHRTIFYKGYDKWVIVVLMPFVLFFIVYNMVDVTLMPTSHYCLLYRLPVFILGVITAYWTQRGYSSKVFLIISLVLLPMFVIHFMGDSIRLRYLSTTFAVPFIIVLLCRIFKKINMLSAVGGG